ncbi:MAG: hypothetical protein WKF55_08095 [Gemmatimonadaceae bacterium]
MSVDSMGRNRQKLISLERLVRAAEAGPPSTQLPNIRLPNFALPNLPAMEPIHASSLEVLASAERTMSLVGQAISSQALAAVGAVSESIRKTFDSLHISLAAYDRNLLGYEEQARNLGACGWTLPLILPVASLPDLLEGIQPGTDYDAAFEDYYLSNNERATRQLFDDLSDSQRLKMWKPLLAECMDAYREAKFRIIVPSLFLILDGALAAAANSLLRKTNAKNLSASKRRTSRRVIETLAWASLEGFTHELFGGYHFGGPRPPRTNRHWVLHGRDVPDWTRADGLRLFQALHSIPA